MLTIKLKALESFDDDKKEFVNSPEVIVELEHSLLSLSKWESEYEKPFLGPDPKTEEETLGYVRAMIQNVEPTDELLVRFSGEDVREINKYIEAKKTATWFKEEPGRPRSREIITAEIIRYWMITMKVPIEYERVHLNQLFTLIKVISEKNKPQKKMSRGEMLAQRRQLNAQRRAAHNTSG